METVTQNAIFPSVLEAFRKRGVANLTSAPVDMTRDFLSLPTIEFDQLLKSHRASPYLFIRVQLSLLPDQRKYFIGERLKAWIEDQRDGQKRAAVVVGTPAELKGISSNAFSSGVSQEIVEER